MINEKMKNNERDKKIANSLNRQLKSFSSSSSLSPSPLLSSSLSANNMISFKKIKPWNNDNDSDYYYHYDDDNDIHTPWLHEKRDGRRFSPDALAAVGLSNDAINTPVFKNRKGDLPIGIPMGATTISPISVVALNSYPSTPNDNKNSVENMKSNVSVKLNTKINSNNNSNDLISICIQQAFSLSDALGTNKLLVST